MLDLKKVISLYVSIFILILSAPALSDPKYIEWTEPNHFPLRFRINLEKLLLEKEINLHQWKLVAPINCTPKDLETLNLKISNPNTFFLPNQVVRFVIQGTGLVYDLHKNSFNLVRVDKTIHSGYNFSASRFYRNNVLFSVGGEGFWNYNKHLTFFDEVRNKEWELYRTKNDGPEVISSGYQGYSKNADAFFSGGDHKKNYLENDSYIFLPNFYAFQFKTKTWELLGEINPILDLKERKEIFWNGEHFIQLASDKVYFINPTKNTIHVYQENTTYFENGTDYFISGDSILYFRNGLNGIPQIIAVNALLKKSTLVGPFYSENHLKRNLFLIGIVLSGLLLFIILKWRKNHQPKFEETELKVLRFLLASKGKMVTTFDINDILECSNKSQESQRRIRHIVINQINTKLEYNHQIKNAIVRIPSEEDKRIVNYQLSPGIEDKIERILSTKV